VLRYAAFPSRCCFARPLDPDDPADLREMTGDAEFGRRIEDLEAEHRRLLDLTPEQARPPQATQTGCSSTAPAR
jgi:hypothetical protein